jgi:hypothetical protein
MPPEVVHWLPRSVVYAVLALVAIGFVLSRLAEAREDIANMLGPVGRWLRDRAKRQARERQRDLDRSIRAALKGAADYRAMQRRIESLEKLVHKLEAEIKKLRLVEETNAAHQDMTAEYLREDAQWHIDAGMLAVEDGFDLPPHRSYSKFCVDYRKKQGMGYGRRWNDDQQR